MSGEASTACSIQLPAHKRSKYRAADAEAALFFHARGLTENFTAGQVQNRAI